MAQKSGFQLIVESNQVITFVFVLVLLRCEVGWVVKLATVLVWFWFDDSQLKTTVRIVIMNSILELLRVCFILIFNYCDRNLLATIAKTCTISSRESLQPWRWFRTVWESGCFTVTWTITWLVAWRHFTPFMVSIYGASSTCMITILSKWILFV